MAKRRISILESFLSGGRVGKSFLSLEKATLNASTRTWRVDGKKEKKRKEVNKKRCMG